MMTSILKLSGQEENIKDKIHITEPHNRTGSSNPLCSRHYLNTVEENIPNKRLTTPHRYAMYHPTSRTAAVPAF